MVDDNVLIRLSGLRFAHPGRRDLFRGLDFSVHRGERLAIIGPTGSGKTTLFHIIMGLMSPGAGKLAVAGRIVVAAADVAFVRKTLGFLFQDSEDQLFCPTVLDDVAFGPLNLGCSPEEVERVVAETLDLLGIPDYADRITYKLSGGEKRLVALATVLAMKPEALLLDEPTNNLDPHSKRELIALLKKIGGTQVICSHDMEFVRATCRRVILINDGDFLADGPTDEILSNGPLMLRNGLEVPFSLEEHRHPTHDHHHGLGPSHGHGHADRHGLDEHGVGLNTTDE